MPLYMDIHYKITRAYGGSDYGRTCKGSSGSGKIRSEISEVLVRHSTGKAFCMVDAPNKEAAAAVHREHMVSLQTRLLKSRKAPNFHRTAGSKHTSHQP